jgi:hypothetical protein
MINSCKNSVIETLGKWTANNHLADFTIESHDDDGDGILAAIQSIVPTSIGVEIIHFSMRSPGGMGKNRTFIIKDISVTQALSIDAVLRVMDHDFVGEYSGIRTHKVEPRFDSWHQLTGERKAPPVWDVMLLKAMAQS